MKGLNASVRFARHHDAFSGVTVGDTQPYRNGMAFAKPWLSYWGIPHSSMC